MNVKLICTDIDGTLYADGCVPEKNLRALRACAARGIRVALVSGRNNGFLCRLSSADCIFSVSNIRDAYGSEILSQFF